MISPRGRHARVWFHVVAAISLFACSSGTTQGQGQSGGASGAAGQSGTGGAGGVEIPVDPAVNLACRNCQQSSAADNCHPLLLTATTTINAATGDPVPVGWGLETLASASQRNAALALVRCINRHGCATNSTNVAAGGNAALGCLGGIGTAPTEILAGTLGGPCVSEYKAAAIADKLNTASDSNAQFAIAIAQAAFDPTTAVGLPDTLVQCAIEAPCPVCAGL